MAEQKTKPTCQIMMTDNRGFRTNGPPLCGSEVPDERQEHGPWLCDCHMIPNKISNTRPLEFPPGTISRDYDVDLPMLEEWNPNTFEVTLTFPNYHAFVQFQLILKGHYRLHTAAPSLLKELQRLEWQEHPYVGFCPVCAKMKGQDHLDDCTLDAAIKSATRE